MINKIPKKPQDSLETASQWEAEYASGSNILVSASAGSGKTYVLTKRIIAKLQSGINIDEILILTFTQKAAKEMQERIEKEIRKEIYNLQETKENPKLLLHFKQQLKKLQTAYISTIDAFCQKIVRNYYFFLPDLNPNYKILASNLKYDELMMQELAFRNVMEKKYQEVIDNKDEKLYKFLSYFSLNADDIPLLEVLNKLIKEASTQAKPKKWLTTITKNYQLDEKLILEQKYNEVYMNHPIIKEYLLEPWSEWFKSLKDITEDDLKDEKDKGVVNLINICLAIYPAYVDNNFEEVVINIQNLKVAKGKSYEKLIERYPFLSKEKINELKNDFFETPSEFCMKCHELFEYVSELSKLAIDYYDEYQKIKYQRSCFEFSDIEHFAYQILTHEVDGDCPVAKVYQEQFVEIMVDEYQDNNSLQDAIIEKISRGNNIFMVGDIKQSIYGFRQANPMLFKNRYEDYLREKDGYLIVLQENFRSKNNVLNFVNFVFAQLMNEEYGQIAYDELAELKVGIKQQKEEILPTEIILYQKKDNLETDEVLVEDGEIEVLAKKIQELVKTGVDYNEIAILVRKKTDNLNIKRIFQKYQIPLQLTDVENYFKTTEIQTMLSLLKIIDNPRQDIPLLAVLRSPIVGLTEVDFVKLSKLKIEIKDKLQQDYYGVIEGLAKNLIRSEDQELVEKIKQFYHNLVKWREAGNTLEISTLIWYLYDETGYLDYVGGLANGLQRQANLQALYQHAKDLESQINHSLSEFLTIIDLSFENNQDLSEVNLDTGEDAVSLMTIHKSKGLEFNYVFLFGIDNKASGKGLVKGMKVNAVPEVSKLSFSMPYLHFINEEETFIEGINLPDIFKEKTTFDKLLTKHLNLQEYAEKMRLLYVALTRAKKQLFLIGKFDKDKTFKTWYQNQNNANLIFGEKQNGSLTASFQTWIGMAILRSPEVQNQLINIDEDYKPSEVLLSEEDKKRLERLLEDNQINLQIMTDDDLKDQEVIIKDEKSDLNSALTDKELSEVQKFFEYKYPYVEETKTTNYQAVSEIKQVFADPDLLILNEQKQVNYSYQANDFKLPEFMQKEKTKISPTKRGQMIHELLQVMDFSKVPTLNYLENLAKSKWPDFWQELNLKQIIDFCQTDLGKLIIENADNLYREQAFSMLLDATRLFKNIKQNDEILVHGIIDAYLKLPNETILIDYKTNLIKKGESYFEFISKMQEEYKGQLQLYKDALKNTLNVTKAYLVLLDIGQVVEVKLDEKI